MRRMAEEAIAADCEKSRLAGAGAVDDACAASLATASTSMPVHRPAVETEGRARARAGPSAPGRLVDPRAHAVLVVDADEDDRQIPQRRHVHALVEDALLHCAVAEKGDGYRRRLAGAWRSAPRRPPPGCRRRRWRWRRDGPAPCRRCASSRPCRRNSQRTSRRFPPSSGSGSAPRARKMPWPRWCVVKVSLGPQVAADTGCGGLPRRSRGAAWSLRSRRAGRARLRVPRRCGCAASSGRVREAACCAARRFQLCFHLPQSCGRSLSVDVVTILRLF